MKAWIVDTNVPIVANGRSDPGDQQLPSIECRLKAISFLQSVVRADKVLLDYQDEIAAEYHRHLNPRGQPGVGDLFYLHVLRSDPQRIIRVDLPRRSDEEYSDLPQVLIEAGFDRGDRKFAALAKKTGGTIANATDSDWLDHRATLASERITVHHVCCADRSRWFVTVRRGT